MAAAYLYFLSYVFFLRFVVSVEIKLSELQQTTQLQLKEADLASFSIINTETQRKLLYYFQSQFLPSNVTKEQSNFDTAQNTDVYVIGDLEGDLGALYFW